MISLNFHDFKSIEPTSYNFLLSFLGQKAVPKQFFDENSSQNIENNLRPYISDVNFDQNST